MRAGSSAGKRGFGHVLIRTSRRLWAFPPHNLAPIESLREELQLQKPATPALIPTGLE